MFLDPNFLHNVGIPAIREHLRQKLAYLRLQGFSGLNRGRGGAMLTPNELVLILGGC